MSLPGRLVERFEAALLDAFPDDDALDKLIRRVGMQGRVPGRAALVTRVGKLVEAVDAQGRVLDLLDAALDLAPGNECLAKAQPAILARLEDARSAIRSTEERLQTPAAGSEPTTPTPAYASAEVEALSKQREAARTRKQALHDAGLATDEVDREILELRRKLRDGGQLRAGDTLSDGRYLLVKRVGRGGFAVVWEAYDRTAERRVAIKVLHQHLAGESQRRERFFRGARVMMDLKHPAIVRVCNPKGEEDSFYYFVMELVPGGNLRDAVLGRRVAGRRLTLIRQVGEALAEAHRKRLVHRDVKPANILLDEDGNAKLTDFDLVGAHDTTGGTRTGALGTVVYAAPECLDKPQNATARADVFGLGMTAIFCFVGQDLSMDTLLDRAGTLAQLDCTEPVRRVLERAVEWKPDRRFADAREMVDALRNALDAKVSTQATTLVHICASPTPAVATSRESIVSVAERDAARVGRPLARPLPSSAAAAHEAARSVGDIESAPVALDAAAATSAVIDAAPGWASEGEPEWMPAAAPQSEAASRDAVNAGAHADRGAVDESTQQTSTNGAESSARSEADEVVATGRDDTGARVLDVERPLPRALEADPAEIAAAAVAETAVEEAVDPRELRRWHIEEQTKIEVLTATAELAARRDQEEWERKRMREQISASHALVAMTRRSDQATTANTDNDIPVVTEHGMQVPAAQSQTENQAPRSDTRRPLPLSKDQEALFAAWQNREIGRAAFSLWWVILLSITAAIVVVASIVGAHGTSLTTKP